MLTFTLLVYVGIIKDSYFIFVKALFFSAVLPQKILKFSIYSFFKFLYKSNKSV